MCADAAIETQVGTVVGGQYRLDAVLGRGGVASIYSARSRDGSRFVVKLLHPSVRLLLGSDPDLLARFRVEQSVAERIRHRGIVQVYGEGETEDGCPYVVMEYLEGADLDSIWGTYRRLSPEPVVAVVEQLLDILQATHAQGVVHCDIKPANIFLTRSSIIKLLDFGLSSLTFRDRQERKKITATGAMLMGNPDFFPPEICRGQRVRDDPRLDIWSAGATMFTLLAGRTVHSRDEDDSVMAIVFRGATQPAPGLLQVAPDVPPRIAGVVDRALAFDMSQRWPTAHAMAGALREAWRASGYTKEASLIGLGGGARDATSA